jgi:hypothetical protein
VIDPRGQLSSNSLLRQSPAHEVNQPVRDLGSAEKMQQPVRGVTTGHRLLDEGLISGHPQDSDEQVALVLLEDRKRTLCGARSIRRGQAEWKGS